MKKILFLAAAALMTMQACRKNADSLPAPELEDDGLSQEAPQFAAMEQALLDQENGSLKSQLDTNRLAPYAKYVVLFKSSFLPPLADTYSGEDVGKEAASFAHSRNVQTTILSRYSPDVISDANVEAWLTVLSSGFYAGLTPQQVKALYRDTAVKVINIPPDYQPEGDEVVYTTGTRPLFLHGYKPTPVNGTKKIWILDNGGSLASPYTNDDPLSKTFVKNAIHVKADHGNQVAHIAASKPYGQSNIRGTAPGARVVLLKVGDETFHWLPIHQGLEYCWLKSTTGDIVNLSFSNYADNTGLSLEMEKAILKFKGWDMPVVIAAGNQNTFAHNRTPARLGLKYKDDQATYGFLYVVANCSPTGTDAEIKARTTKFVLNEAYESNYGRAVRYALVGSWTVRKVSGQEVFGSGTSYSAPALAGILFHGTKSVRDPYTLLNVVRYKRGTTTYTHLVPTLLF